MITVPQGGIDAGRAAQVDISQQPDIGGMVAQAAGAVQEKFGQIKAQQRAIQVESTKLDIVKDIGTERQRFDQMTDPAQIDAEWPQVEAAIMDKYVNAKGPDGKPLLTPEEADALGLTIKDMSTRHGLALGERAINLTQSQASAAWSAARLDIVNTAATSDPDTMVAMMEYGEAAIDKRLAAGIIMPEAAEAEKAAFRYDVMNARAITAVSSDPDTFLGDLEAGDFNDLGAERVAALKVTAQTEVNQRLAAEQKAVEVQTKTRDDAIGRRLDTIADLKTKGRRVVDEEFLENPAPEVLAHPNYPKAKAALDLSREMPDLGLKTVAELDSLIAAEKDREIVEAWDDQRLTVLEAMRETKQAAYNTDPKAGAADAGLPVPELPEFDPADPQAFAAGLAEAVSFDGYLRDKGYTNRSAIFDNDQRAALKAVLDPKAEAGPKVALAEAIIAGTQGNAAPVLADLEADPTFKRTVKVLALTGDTSLATSILRGAQKAEADTVLKLPRADQIRIFDEVTGGVFEDAPVAVREELMAAAAALYADGATGLDPTAQPDDAGALYEKSFMRLLGAQPDRNGNLTIGGMQEVNGALTVLPIGVSAEAVDMAFDKLGTSLEGYYGGGAGRAGQGPGGTQSEPNFTAFAGASVYGGLPDLGSKPSEMLATLTLRRVGETDVYELVRETNGRMIPVREKDGEGAYRFRLPDLLRGVQP